MEFIRDYLLNGLVSAISLLAGWFFGRRRDNAEVRSLEADAIANIQAVYDRFVLDTRKRAEEGIVELERSRAEIAKLATQVEKMKDTIHLLEDALEMCRKTITKMNNDLG